MGYGNNLRLKFKTKGHLPTHSLPARSTSCNFVLIANFGVSVRSGDPALGGVLQGVLCLDFELPPGFGERPLLLVQTGRADLVLFEECIIGDLNSQKHYL